MNHKTAKQILESYGVSEVLYHGEPVWIEQVKNELQAEITVLTSNERIEVPLDQLIKKDSAK